MDNISYIRSNEQFLHPGRGADIMIGKKKIGYMGQLHPLVAACYDLCEEVCVGEIDAEVLIDNVINKNIASKPLAKYPAAERDIALIADINLLSDEIKNVILHHGGKNLRNCEAFDVYVSDTLGKNKKSIAYNLLFRSDNETLTDDKIDKYITNILKALKEELNINLRL